MINMITYSVVICRNGKEVGRLKPHDDFELALKKVRQINKSMKQAKSYVEETHTVKHLPILERVEEDS